MCSQQSTSIYTHDVDTKARRPTRGDNRGTFDSHLPMALITLLNAQLAFGHVALLDHTDFALEVQERVGLIGRNEIGRSSLLKILAGLEKPDDGTLQIQTGLRVAYVPQEPILDLQSPMFAWANSPAATRSAWHWPRRW